MSTDATTLARTVMAMRPIVPAKDFEISKRFYIELGFEPKTLTDRLVEMQLGVFSFILQAYYVQQWIGVWWPAWSIPPGYFGGSPRRPLRIRTETRRANEPAD